MAESDSNSLSRTTLPAKALLGAVCRALPPPPPRPQPNNRSGHDAAPAGWTVTRPSGRTEAGPQQGGRRFPTQPRRGLPLFTAGCRRCQVRSLCATASPRRRSCRWEGGHLNNLKTRNEEHPSDVLTSDATAAALSSVNLCRFLWPMIRTVFFCSRSVMSCQILMRPLVPSRLTMTCPY